jgi:moderate conductance mechanosensitive channel
MQIFFNELRRAEVWTPWAVRGVRFLFILAAAFMLSRIAKGLLARMRKRTLQAMARRGDLSDLDLEKRAATLATVMFTVIRWGIWIVAWGMALHELNFDIQPILAGLGVAGLALGLGAQTLIKDWLGGLMLLLEDQLRIGDSVTINGISGSVEEINLRTTVLRTENGSLHMIPNGSITTLSNGSREYSYYLFETTVAYQADARRAMEILKEVGGEIVNDERFAYDAVGDIEVYGVDKLADKGTVLKARIKTRPSRQWGLGRELNLRVKERFNAEQIPFPAPDGTLR